MEPCKTVSVAAVRHAGQRAGGIEEAESMLGVRDLPALLADEDLGRAWQQGRLWRRLGELAATPLCEETAAKALGMALDAFRKVLGEDIVAKEIWDTGRQAILLRAKNSIVAAAERGEAYAVRMMDRLVRSQTVASGSKTDFRNLTQTELEAATGIKRAQLRRWERSHGLPVTGSGTYSLPDFVKWLRRADVGRVRGYRRRPGAVEARIVEEFARAEGKGTEDGPEC
ncbi:MAG: helix-turn-helix transcriptional regulator [Planctomycetes bacterium]|nr:helix-turn-helix transcriptional regulator [Planctomycetota bacterium]